MVVQKAGVEAEMFRRAKALWILGRREQALWTKASVRSDLQGLSVVGPSVVVMEQQPEHEGASEVIAPGPPPIWPGASVPGVALGDVFGDLASWKSARGRETAASPASWMPSANAAAVVDGAVAGVEEAVARVGAAEAGVEEADAAVEKAEARVGAAGIEASAAGSLLDWLEVAAHATEKAVGEPAWRHTEDGLGAAMRLIGQLRSCLDRVEVAVVAEVESQGTPDGRGLSPVDWLVDASGAAAPKPDVQHVARVLNVARAMGSSEPASDVFSEAVRSGAMPLVKADLVARFVQDVRRVADPRRWLPMWRRWSRRRPTTTGDEDSRRRSCAGRSSSRPS